MNSQSPVSKPPLRGALAIGRALARYVGMRATRQDAVYAAIGTISAATFALTSTGTLQRWFGVEGAEGLFLMALLLGAFACQHALLLALVTLAKKGIQPVAWLFTRSRPAIRAVLHVLTFLIFAIGGALGWALGSNPLLAGILGLSLTVGYATEWTFAGGMGPLAKLLRERDRDRANRG